MALKFFREYSENEVTQENVEQVQQEPEVPQRRRGRRLNTEEARERKLRCLQLKLYDKLSFTDFRTQVADEFNITARQAERLWKEIEDDLKERFDQERDKIILEQLGRLFDLLNRAKAANNYKTENEVLKEISKLYQLDTKRVDITSGGEKINITVTLTDE